jgi:SAM-dependent methyltransferase
MGARRAREAGAGPAVPFRPSDVVGMPVLPPGGVATAAERLRAVVGGWHRRLAPPPLQVLEGVLGQLDPVALGALCRLGVPDRLDRPVPLAVLASELDADDAVVERLVRYAAGRGWLRLDRRNRVRPTATTRFLRRDHPGGWRAWVEFACGPEVMAAAAQLAAAPGTPDAFAAANGASFFDWYAAHPERHAAFDAAMAAGGRLHGLALAGAVDWSGVRRVCDVGGGTGAVLGVLLDRHPHLRGVLFDLPPVVARAAARQRLDVVGGDAFAGLPTGCDVYLFVNVVHDWDDQAAVRLLRGVRAASPDGGRALVVEGERRSRPVDGVALRADLLMLAVAPGGRERTTEELRDLATAAGLRLTTTTRLASGDRAHTLVAD